MNLDQEYSRYINYFHGMELLPDINQPDQRGNENGILFLSVYLLLKYAKFGKLEDYEIKDFIDITQRLQVEPGLFDRGAKESLTIPYTQRRSISHDNITAITLLTSFLSTSARVSKQIATYGLKHFFVYNNVKPRLVPPVNPGNWSLYLYLGGYKFLSLFFLPIAFINLMISSAKSYDTTSGKQLNFVELYPLKDEFVWKYFWRYYRSRMVKMYGEEWISKIMSIYYTYPLHPIRYLADGLKL